MTIILAAKIRPRHGEGLIIAVRPLHEGNGDAVRAGVFDGLADLGVSEGGRQAVALQVELLIGNAGGSIEGQHQLQGDGGFIDGRRPGWDHIGRRRSPT